MGNLNLDQVAGNQNQKEVTGNDQADQLDVAITEINTFTVDASDTRTLTAEEFRRTRTFIIDEAGADADIVITVPAIKRGEFLIRNDTAFNVDVTISGQSKVVPSIAAGRESILQCDGVDVIYPDALLKSLIVRDNVVASLLEVQGFETTATGVGINFSKSRGTVASPSTVSAGDTLGVLRGRAHDGTSFITATNMQMKCVAVSGSNISGSFVFRTADTGGTLQDRMTIDDADLVTFSGEILTATPVVAGLPAAGTAGRRSFVTDSNATMTAGIGAVVAGGGSDNVPVHDDGTNWRIG